MRVSAFLELGPGRRLKEAAELLGVSEEALDRWCQLNSWQSRAAAWDDHNADVRQAARDKVNAERAAEWERRRLDECEAVYGLSRELRAKAREMLATDLYTVR